MALFLLVFWLSLPATSIDMSESMRLSVDCVFLFVPWIVDRMSSLIFLFMVWVLIRRLCAKLWLESGIVEEIDGIFWAFASTDSIRGSSFLLNLRTLRLILFRSAFATRSPTAREYEGGGEYFGGASLWTSRVLERLRGTTIGWGWFRFCWHRRLMGKWRLFAGSSIGGRNKSSIRCGEGKYCTINNNYCF